MSHRHTEMSRFVEKSIRKITKLLRARKYKDAEKFVEWAVGSVSEVASHASRLMPVFATFNSAIPLSFVNRYARPGEFAKFETIDRSEKREVMLDQCATLDEHCDKQGLELHELTVAGDPRAHLRSCTSASLTSYELVPNRVRMQNRGAPYDHPLCKRQKFLNGDLMLAVMRRVHPECNFLNADTMFSYTNNAVPLVEAMISGFLGEGTEPKYIRCVSTIARANRAGASHGLMMTEQKARMSCISRVFKIRPIEEWRVFPTRSHRGVLMSRVYFYKPDKALARHLQMTHRIADACTAIADVRAVSVA